jgi:hypothetical protein
LTIKLSEVVVRLNAALICDEIQRDNKELAETRNTHTKHTEDEANIAGTSPWVPSVLRRLAFASRASVADRAFSLASDFFFSAIFSWMRPL